MIRGSKNVGLGYQASLHSFLLFGEYFVAEQKWCRILLLVTTAALKLPSSAEEWPGVLVGKAAAYF